MKKLLRFIVAGIGVGLLVTQVTLRAHHAFSAEFDATKTVSLKGTVSKMDWFSPHAWLYVDVKGPDGDVQTWALEFGGANSLFKKGWRTTDLPVGAEVSVDGYLAKNATHTANARTVKLTDGRQLFAGSSVDQK